MSRRRNEIMGRARVRSLRIRGNSANPGNANLRRILMGSTTWDAGSLIDAAGESKDVTVTGAALGDFAIASVGVSTVGAVLTATVTAADTVTVRVQNESGSTLDMASTTLRVLVIKADTLA